MRLAEGIEIDSHCLSNLRLPLTKRFDILLMITMVNHVKRLAPLGRVALTCKQLANFNKHIATW